MREHTVRRQKMKKQILIDLQPRGNAAQGRYEYRDCLQGKNIPEKEIKIKKGERNEIYS